MSTCYVKVLTVSEARSSDLRIETDIPQVVGDERFLKCFWELCSWLIDFVLEAKPVSTNVIDQYRTQSKVISEYFRQAIVPSTIVVEGKREHPSPVVLINAAFRFYLESIPGLIKNVNKENPASVEARSRFAERLELWSLKALEDCRLLESELQHGGRSQS
ncbi:MAG: hypothetical protein ABR880_24045 [Candidatus Sulfotelmatobacter sp.]